MIWYIVDRYIIPILVLVGLFIYLQLTIVNGAIFFLFCFAIALFDVFEQQEENQRRREEEEEFVHEEHFE